MQNNTLRSFLKFLGIVLVGIVVILLIISYVFKGNQKKTKATASDSVMVSLGVTTPDPQHRLFSLSAQPGAPITVRGYRFTISFDKTKAQIDSFTYRLGTVSIGLGDGTIASINTGGSARFQAESNTATGTILAASPPTELVQFTMSSATSDYSSVRIEAGGKLYKINADSTLVDVPATVTSPTATPAPTATATTVPVATATTVPVVTPGLIQARLKFKVRLPDIAPGVASIQGNRMLIEVFDGTRVVVNMEGQHNLIKSGNYFETSSPNIILSSDLGMTLRTDNTYRVSIKLDNTIRRTFNNVKLVMEETIDCTVAENTNCGEFITKRDDKPLFSGDSDGFGNTSGSYNKIDSADLFALAAHFNTDASTNDKKLVDFNKDGQVNIGDLEIYGRNYQMTGD